MDPAKDRRTTEKNPTVVESLKLIVQSQMILEELQRNQRRLEELIQSFEETEG